MNNINYLKIKETFDNIVNKYDKSHNVINLKYNHTFRVAKNCEAIARYLNLNETEIYIAYLIGILHDIGRFKQIKEYDTLWDTDEMNHGEYGYKVLKDGLLYNFIDDKKYNNIILECVRGHNKICIDDNLDDYTKLFLKIIRDADKIDIYYVMTNEEIHDVNVDNITDYSYNTIMNEKLIDYKDITTDFELVLVILCYIYDLNYKYSFEQIYINDYINKLINIYKYSDNAKVKLEKIRSKLNKYIEMRK